ncbi:STAS domain-containing protein [Flavobacteriales bacterium]|nr:STAS domain-containing protein [Flavobacteriales bacterium]MDB4088720.1 STAS domain-containing protein [Flavobacteriales bacterium]
MNLTYTTSQTKEGIIIFNLSGKILSKEDSEEISNGIDENIEKENFNIILNLEELDYINSTGLNFIISSFTKMRNAGGELVISSVSQKVEDLLVITKLNTIFTSFKSLTEAKESFSK